MNRHGRGGAARLAAWIVIALGTWVCGEDIEWTTRPDIVGFTGWPGNFGFHPWPVTLIDERALPELALAPKQRITPAELRDPESELVEWVTVTRRAVDEDGRPVGAARAWIVPQGDVLDALGLRVQRSIHTEGFWMTPQQTLLEIPDGLPEPSTANPSGRFRVSGPAYLRGAAHEIATLAVSWSPAPLDALLVVEGPGKATVVDWLGNGTERGSGSHELSEADVVLLPGADLVGRVLDGSSRPVAGASVRLITVSRGEVRAHFPGVHQATSGTDGGFVLEALPAGARCRLDVRAPGFVRQELKLSVPEVGVDAEVVRIELEASREIRGVVRDEAGRVVDGARVFALETSWRSSATSDEDTASYQPGDDVAGLEQYIGGRYDALWAEVDAEGRFTLDVEARDPPTYTVSAVAPGAELAVRQDVAAGTGDVELVLRPESRLLVEFVDAVSGESFEPVMFLPGRYIGPGHGSLVLPTRRLSASSWLVEGVGPSGTHVYYRVPATADRPEFGVHEVVAGQAVATVACATVRVPRRATIRGRVLGGWTAPGEHAPLWAARLNGDGQPLVGNGYGTSGGVDDSGHFVVHDVFAQRVLVGCTGEEHAECPKVEVDTSRGGEHFVEIPCARPSPFSAR